MCDVEAVLDFWHGAHREVAGTHGGVIRQVLFDQFILSFDTCGAALGAWLGLIEAARTFSARPDCPLQLRFGAAMDLGEVRVFRSSLRGAPLRRAIAWCNEAGPEAAVLDGRLLDAVAPELLGRVDRRRG